MYRTAKFRKNVMFERLPQSVEGGECGSRYRRRFLECEVGWLQRKGVCSSARILGTGASARAKHFIARLELRHIIVKQRCPKASPAPSPTATSSLQVSPMKIMITSGSHKGRIGSMEAHVFQKSVDYPDEPAHGFHVI